MYLADARRGAAEVMMRKQLTYCGEDVWKSERLPRVGDTLEGGTIVEMVMSYIDPLTVRAVYTVESPEQGASTG